MVQWKTRSNRLIISTNSSGFWRQFINQFDRNLSRNHYQLDNVSDIGYDRLRKKLTFSTSSIYEKFYLK